MPSNLIVFRHRPSKPTDPARRALVNALRDYRADAQRCLLGIAYALARDPAGAPAKQPGGSDEEHIGALDLPEALALPDPGGWAGVEAVLLDGPSARRARALGLDVDVLALLEVHRLERAGVGPAAGILRRQGAHSAAWQRVRQIASAQARAPLVVRVAAALDGGSARLSTAMQRDLTALHGVLADEGVPLLRLAAAQTHTTGAFTAQMPAPVRGAPGWEVHLRIEPTVDGAWLVTARRVWAGAGPAPRAPIITIILHAGHGSHAREVHQRIDNEDPCTMWYEDRQPGPTPRLSARSDEGPAGS